MLPRKSRLSARSDITTTLRSGHRIHTPYATVYVRRSDLPRATCIVGKRVYKGAVARHRLQRQLREVARVLLSQTSGPYDIVIVAQPKAAQVKKLSELREMIVPAVLQFFKKRKTQSEK